MSQNIFSSGQIFSMSTSSQNSQISKRKNVAKLSDLMTSNFRLGSLTSQNDSLNSQGCTPTTSLSSTFDSNFSLKSTPVTNKEIKNHTSLNQSLLKENALVTRMDSLESQINKLEKSTDGVVKEITSLSQSLGTFVNRMDEKHQQLEEMLVAIIEKRI
jgi:hypothetical protein